MPAKPPEFWDDGHILDQEERTERDALVAKWRSYHEERMAEIFLRAKEVFTKAGMNEKQVTIQMPTRMRGISRDIIAEASRGDYNILAFGRRGLSAISDFTLGSRAAKMLQSARDCSLIVVN